MSNVNVLHDVKTDRASSRQERALSQERLVIDLGVSAERAVQLVIGDDPGWVRSPGPEWRSGGVVPDPVLFRVVVWAPGSTVDVYYRDVDPVGEPYWERLSDGVTFDRIPIVTFWRRMVVAEAFRRLAAEGSRRVTEAPTGVPVVDLGVV